MDGLVVLLALVPIVILVLGIITASRTGSIARDVEELRKEVAALRGSLRSDAPRPTSSPAPTAAPVRPTTYTQPPPQPIFIDEPAAPALPSFEQPPVIPAAKPMPVAGPALPRPDMPIVPPIRGPGGPPPRATWWENFIAKNPDLEKFIGENLINKVGIAVLVLGLGFLLRYAIDEDYINETGRVLIGIGAGAVLIVLAHRMRMNFRAFSSVLIGGGISVFYFTIAIAFRSYDDMFTQTQAFAIMVVITALAVAFAIAYDRRELAVIALLGGFGAPFMVSTGEGNFRVLFTFLLILDTGMLVLALRKRWNIVHLVAYALTILIMGGWAASEYNGMDPRPYGLAFLFATGFHLVFFAMAIGYNLKHRLTFRPLEFGLLLSNAAAYYAIGLHFLSDGPVKVTGLFTAALGLFHASFAFWFYRKRQIPRNLVHLLIGLALTFCTLAVPVQLEGSRITLFWAAEAALLLWFSQRIGVRLVERGALLVGVLMLVSLLMDWSNIYGYESELVLRPLLNKGWITGLVAFASLSAMHVLWSREKESHPVLPMLRSDLCARVALIFAVIVFYLFNLLELRHQCWRVMESGSVGMASMIWTLLVVLALDRFTLKRGPSARLTAFIMLWLSLLGCITFFHINSVLAMNAWLVNEDRWFPIHWIGLVLAAYTVVRTAKASRETLMNPSQAWTGYLWATCILLVVLASQELDHLMLLTTYDPQELPMQTLREARRVGYPILWGVGSFLFMWYGMRRGLRTVRILSLCLFAITLLKLFLLDLRGISEGGKVAAFICLGILLLVVSFMYNKLKHLLIDGGGEGVKSEK